MEDMQHQVMGYDRTATMFAPDGHILQVEYAEKTIRLGSASIGIVCKDCVIIVSDKRKNHKLVVEGSGNKIHEIDAHLMVTFAGINSDARVLIEKARVLAQQHRITYDSKPSTEGIVKDIADMKQQFTQYAGARPFGVALMIAGFDSVPKLYTTEVSGGYLQYKANAIGERDEKLKDLLKEKYKEGLGCEQGIKLALDVFKDVLGDGFNIERFDVGVIDNSKKMKMLSPGELKELM